MVDTTDKLVAYGVLRSGSTLMWQVMVRLFDQKNVIKTHSLVETDKKVVATYRDFRDVGASSFRIEKGIDKPEKLRLMTEEEVQFYFNRAAGWATILDSYKKHYSADRLLFMRYEDFFNNFQFIFEAFETFFNIKIPKSLRKKIHDECNIHRNKTLAEKATKKKPQWPSRMHSAHIFTGEPGTWRLVVPEALHSKATELVKESLERWGYGDD